MIKLKRESKLSFFWLQFWADNRTRFVRQSQNKIRPKDFMQDNRSDSGASSEFLREQKEGCNPLALRPGASSIRRIGITCYTSLISFRLLLFYSAFCGILKVTDLIANMVLYIVHIFGKHGLLYIPFLRLKMEFYT